MRILLVFLLLSASTSAQTSRDLVVSARQNRRVALVIGNDEYQGNTLRNAVNDARSMKSALEDSGFGVQMSLNVRQQQMETAIDRFTGDVRPGDIAVFFYAGHGMQIGDQNYLIPVDFQARTAVDAKYKAYPAQRIQENLEAAGVGMQILILDACRNNPFRSWRDGSGGLTAMQAGRGTYIAFATSPGRTADDSPSGGNGLFTGQLIEVLHEPGLSIDQVFNRVRERVAAESQGRQLPWSTSSVTGEFYFKMIPPGVTSPHGEISGDRELAFWNSVKDENDVNLLEEYLRRYQTGEFATIARSKLNKLKATIPASSPISKSVPANSASDAKPNFTGTWKLNIAKSDFGPIPPPESEIDKIDHNEPNVRFAVDTWGTHGEHNYILDFTANGKEQTQTQRLSDREVRTTSHWDGSRLVVLMRMHLPKDLQTRKRRVKTQSNDIVETSTYALTQDGQTLVCLRLYGASVGAADQRLIFEKQ